MMSCQTMNRYLREEIKVIHQDVCVMLDHYTEPKEIMAKVDWWTMDLDPDQQLLVMLYLKNKFSL